MIYAAVVGRNPFAAESLHATYRRNSRGLVPLSSVAARGLSEDLQRLVRKLCAIDPSERYSSAEASVDPWFFAEPSKPSVDCVDARKRVQKPSWDALVSEVWTFRSNLFNRLLKRDEKRILTA